MKMKPKIKFADMELVANIAHKVHMGIYASMEEGLEEYGTSHLPTDYAKECIRFGNEILEIVNKIVNN